MNFSDMTMSRFLKT